jgi:hypothetical protein
MKTQRLAVILSAVNVVILLILLGQFRPVGAQDVAPVLRGRALEIVDGKGHVRAEVKVLPADPAVKMPDGTVGYPETVILRLIDSEGSPNVKLSATEDGSGLVLGGDAGYVQALSRYASPTVKIVSKDGRETSMDAKPRP